MSVWRDGEAVPDASAPGRLDRGLLLGDGLFETVLVRDGAALRLDAHLARLARSAAMLAFPDTAGLAADLARAVPALWQAERRPARAALRVTLTRGAGRGLDVPATVPAALPDGLAAHVTIALHALPDALPGAPAGAVTAVVLRAPRIDPLCPLAGHKTTSALPAVTARRAARSRGADRAIRVTVDGDVACGDAANVFAVLAGRLVTPPLSRGVLPGVTRARVIAALSASDTPVHEERLEVDDLRRADEVFLTSSLALVEPVAALDGLGLAAPGRVALSVAAALHG